MKSLQAILLVTASTLLSGCALITATTLIAAGPALTEVLPGPPPLPDGYETVVLGELVNVSPTRRSLCPGRTRIPLRLQPMKCVKLGFQGDTELSQEEVIAIARSIAANNPYMTWPEEIESTIIEYNRFPNNEFNNALGNNIAPQFRFLYATNTTVEQVFSFRP